MRNALGTNYESNYKAGVALCRALYVHAAFPVSPPPLFLSFSSSLLIFILIPTALNVLQGKYSQVHVSTRTRGEKGERL